MPRVLIIDDSIIDHDRIRLSFMRHDPVYDLAFASTATAGIEAIRRDGFGAVFVSQYLPDMDGFKFLRRLKKLNIDIPVIMLIRDQGRNIVMKALKEGATDTLMRSIRYFDYMPYVFEKAVARFELERERSEMDALIKSSQRQWMAIFDGITDFVFMTDLEHRIVRTNVAMAKAFERHPRELVGVKCYELFGVDESRLICKLPELPKTEEIAIRDRTYMVSVFPIEYDNQQYLSTS